MVAIAAHVCIEVAEAATRASLIVLGNLKCLAAAHNLPPIRS